MDLSAAIKVFLLAASPILECRGAIPYGFYAGLSPLEVYVLSLLGNLMP
ncbi:MAG TPA: ligand-binding protein SH3, partial [Candidatus Methanomethylia archaeon]|nr:ligand-binding protein SH3 [Candidatus Methanomethylicia archaeon]